MRKRFIPALTVFVLLLSLGATATFSTESSTFSTSAIRAIAESNSTIVGNYKHYSEFTVNGKGIRLCTETTLTAEDAMEAYPNAYELVSSEAESMGISNSLDDPDFQSFAKIYAGFFEGGSDELVNECHQFSIFLDYYENTAQNQKIIEAISLGFGSSNSREFAESVNIDELMPTLITPTVASGGK